MGLTTAKAPDPIHLIYKKVLKVGEVIEFEVQPTSVQLMRKAKLPTVIGLTTKHVVCCNTLML